MDKEKAIELAREYADIVSKHFSVNEDISGFKERVLKSGIKILSLETSA